MRRVLVIAVVVAISAVFIPPSWAGVIESNVADGILTVTGTAEGDDIAVRCESGQVTVNQAQPSGSPVACADLRRIMVLAGGGSDRVSLGEVTRSVFGDLSATSVSGQGGEDTLIGSDIGDDLVGGGGVDSLRGGNGPDLLAPGTGGGETIGGEGRDEVSVSGDSSWDVNDDRIERSTPYEQTTLQSIEQVEIVLGPSDNFVSGAGFSGALALQGRGGNDLMASGPGRDVLDGGDGNDRLESGAGADKLFGRGGDDFLAAGAGNDELNGGPGADGCNGESGADSFTSC